MILVVTYLNLHGTTKPMVFLQRVRNMNSMYEVIYHLLTLIYVQALYRCNNNNNNNNNNKTNHAGR